MAKWDGTGTFDGMSGKCADRPDGGFDLLFGGGGGANPNDGHGHMVVNGAGCVEYLREPGHCSDRTAAIDYDYGEGSKGGYPYWS